MTPYFTPWMDEPIAWTGAEQDNAAQWDPRVLELRDELCSRLDADRLAEAWDEVHAKDAARQARPHD
jgi:hypothetical protein